MLYNNTTMHSKLLRFFISIHEVKLSTFLQSKVWMLSGHEKAKL